MNNARLTETETRVLKSLHLRGCTGPMGSMSKKQRLTLLQSLIDRGFLNKNLSLTQFGVNSTSNYRDTMLQ